MQVWPYLLGHYSMESDEEERKRRDEKTKRHYNSVVSQWTSCERAIMCQVLVVVNVVRYW